MQSSLINHEDLADLLLSSCKVVFKKLCHFLKLLKTGMMHYGNYI